MSYIPDIALTFLISNLKYGTSEQDFLDVISLTEDKNIESDVFKTFYKSFLNTKQLALNNDLNEHDLCNNSNIKINEQDKKRKYNYNI